MPFTYEREQLDFIEMVTEFLRDHARRGVGGQDPGKQLWHSLLDLDLPALLIPEERGGLGLTAIDMVAVLEAAGHFALGVPLAMTVGPFAAACATVDVDGVGTRELIDRVLAGATGTVAPTWIASDGSKAPTARLAADRLTVRSGVVADADADLIAVPALRADAGEQVLVVGTAEQLGLTFHDGIDPSSKLGRIDVADRQLDGVAVLDCTRSIRPMALIAMAAELVGLAAELVQLSVEYARDRVQFGQPIGHFQAVKHRLVDAHMGVERSRSLTLYAALSVDDADAHAARAAHRAKAAASEAATFAARTAVQVHGGSGITAEQAVSGLYLRARERSSLLGGPDEHYAAARQQANR